MKNNTHSFRSEIINSLRSDIQHQHKRDITSVKVLNRISSQLLLVENHSEKKSLIKLWYKELISADTLRKHHLNYQKPQEIKELSQALYTLTINFKKRFHNYFSG